MITYAGADLLGARKDHTATRAAFENLGFVAVKNAATVSQAQDIFAEAAGFLDQVRKATRDDADLKYSAGIAMLGPKAHSFLQSKALSEALHALTGDEFVLTQNMSCITVYEAGDQLGAHLDQPAERCAVTCILYLACRSPAPHSPDSGLQLKIFGEDKGSTR
ncbi:MAG TPA: hypothetical protein ENK28_10795, partial [Aliiroseovarius sp.]|nr:hypothetical protein [Aliiroseovarius sp.]